MDIVMRSRALWGLDAGEHSVLLCLAWRLNDQSGQCNPSASTIAADTGIGRKRVLRLLHALASKGLIQIVGAGQRSGRASNHYLLNLSGVTETPQNEINSGVAETPQAGDLDHGSGVDPARSGVDLIPSGVAGAPEHKNNEEQRSRSLAAKPRALAPRDFRDRVDARMATKSRIA